MTVGVAGSTVIEATTSPDPAPFVTCTTPGVPACSSTVSGPVPSCVVGGGTASSVVMTDSTRSTPRTLL